METITLLSLLLTACVCALRPSPLDAAPDQRDERVAEAECRMEVNCNGHAHPETEESTESQAQRTNEEREAEDQQNANKADTSDPDNNASTEGQDPPTNVAYKECNGTGPVDPQDSRQLTSDPGMDGKAVVGGGEEEVEEERKEEARMEVGPGRGDKEEESQRNG